jgi:hypothetical protein
LDYAEIYNENADAILLICRIMDEKKLMEFISFAYSLGLECLVHAGPCFVDVSLGVETDVSNDVGKINRVIGLVRSKG